MLRAFVTWIAIASLWLGALGKLPGAHRCAIAAAAEAHGCCPHAEEEAAPPAQPEACAGDCCRSDAAVGLASVVAPLEPPLRAVNLPRPRAALLPPPRQAPPVVAHGPRGPPPPPRSPPYLRHASLLL